MSSLSAPSDARNDDLEALVTSKKDDDSLNATGSENSSPSYYRFDMLRRNLLQKNMGDLRAIVTAIIVISFSVIGVVTVARDLNSYSQLQRGTEATSPIVVGGHQALMNKGPDDYTFDGHIDPIQTRGMSLLSKLAGVEPHGGEKTISAMMENIVDSPSPSTGSEIIFLWEAGGVGSIANDICKCFPINMATTFGSEEVGDPRVLQPHAMDGELCGLYNVNLGTHSGTRRAKDLGLITNTVPDLISSPFLPEIASLFTPERKGRIILVVPNTGVRLKFSYDHLKRKGIFNGSMLEFVSSDHVLANNYLTHMLSGKWGGGVEELTEDDFAVAVSVLRTKMTVATWADNRRMVDYITRNQQWDESGLECMYPPENPYSIEQAEKAKTEPRPPPPEKTPEQIATETAIKLHNYYDDRLFAILAEQAQEQAATIL